MTTTEVHPGARPRFSVNSGLALALALIASSHLSTPAQAQACNDNSRTIQVPAGTTSAGEQNCPSITFTVNVAGSGVEFTTPTSCSKGSTVRDEDTWSCGPPANGMHCDPQGYEVKVKVYSIGNEDPCPGIPDTLPETLKEAEEMFKCKQPPLVNSFHVYSAAVTACDTGIDSALRMDGEIVDGSADSFTVVTGDPDHLLAQQEPNELYEQLVELQSSPIDSLPTELQTVVALHPSLNGARNINALVEYEFADVPNYGDVVNRFRVEGTVLASGRFSVSSTTRTTLEGDVVPSIEELSYDGTNFFIGTPGSPRFNAYSASSPQFPRAFSSQARFVEPLLDWVRSPFPITLFPDIDRTSAVTGPSGEETLVEIRETYPGMFDGTTHLAGEIVYVLSVGAVIHPVEVRYLDGAGNLTTRVTFSNYGTLDEGLWRPFLVVRREYSPGSSEPWLTCTLTVTEAELVSEAEASATLPRAQSTQNRWFVRH